MRDKAVNAGAVLLASLGMAFTALGIIGFDPTPSVYDHPSIQCKQ